MLRLACTDRFVTAVGASLVFFVPSTLSVRQHRLLLDTSLGFAAGLMLAASYFSLLAPDIEFAQESGQYGENGRWSFVPACVGVLLGGVFVHLSDRLLPHSETDTVSLLAQQHAAEGKRRTSPTAHARNGGIVVNGAATDGTQPTSPVPRAQLLRRTRSTASNTALDEAAAITPPHSSKGSKKKKSVMRRMDSVQMLDKLESQTTSQHTSFADSEQPTTAATSNSAASSASWRRLMLMIVAIVIHNFPEGMAVGVAFGATSDAPAASAASFQSAVSLTVGIALQNFPEGLAVSLPLLRLGFSPLRSFFYGQLSGLVEPFGGVLGAAVVGWVQPVLPYALAFAAGAMIYVVMDDLAVEIKSGGAEEAGNSDEGGSVEKGRDGGEKGTVGMTGVMVGFVVMMALDVALG